METEREDGGKYLTCFFFLLDLQIVNLMLTLCDTQRVGEDMGKIQFQLKVLHMPIIGWKGSYVVSLVSVMNVVEWVVI